MRVENARFGVETITRSDHTARSATKLRSNSPIDQRLSARPDRNTLEKIQQGGPSLGGSSLKARLQFIPDQFNGARSAPEKETSQTSRLTPSPSKRNCQPIALSVQSDANCSPARLPCNKIGRKNRLICQTSPIFGSSSSRSAPLTLIAQCSFEVFA